VFKFITKHFLNASCIVITPSIASRLETEKNPLLIYSLQPYWIGHVAATSHQNGDGFAFIQPLVIRPPVASPPTTSTLFGSKIKMTEQIETI